MAQVRCKAHRLALREGAGDCKLDLANHECGTATVARLMLAREQSAMGYTCQQRRAALCKAGFCLEAVQTSLPRVNACHDVIVMLSYGDSGPYLRHALLTAVTSSGHVCDVIVIRCCLNMQKVLGGGLGGPAAVAISY